MGGYPGWRDFDPAQRKVIEKLKRAKYGNEPTTVDGIHFDSKREAERWQELQSLERAGVIQALDRQINFALNVTSPAGAVVRVADYRADFVFVENGKLCVEECKGYRHNPVWLLKRKMFEAQYGIRIRVS